ncbi:MAG: hypothetical protein A3A82_01835 [Candidatus Pacebacteria bacterium RIFCSPLOWO2_01_FULL_47_12]|nr:MAG: hypothetical protein A3J60_02130 [Candidatus Pacebacteria bacterium RIFCSPHIGHO2_02_FULL_46_9]OGJ37633.1 MAG: hypothetical protein A3A82_01835 [Candidatus Pacebacteria bacterium RIFCSPLOWO2_01_FULL_47_12]
MITTRQAITSQYYPAQLWSVAPTDQQQTLVCDNSAKLLGQTLTPHDLAVTWYNLEASTIGIDQVRELQTRLSYSSGSRRFVCILFADHLTQQAQHALLKLLEEPPAQTQLVLVSSKPHLLLATIRSRCSEQLLQFTGKKLAQPDTVDQYVRWKKLTISEAIGVAEAYKKKEVALPTVETLITCLRNELRHVTNREQLQTLLRDIDHCLVALEQLEQNVHCQLVIEALLFRLSRHASQ